MLNFEKELTEQIKILKEKLLEKAAEFLENEGMAAPNSQEITQDLYDLSELDLCSKFPLSESHLLKLNKFSARYNSNDNLNEIKQLIIGIVQKNKQLISSQSQNNSINGLEENKKKEEFIRLLETNSFDSRQSSDRQSSITFDFFQNKNSKEFLNAKIENKKIYENEKMQAVRVSQALISSEITDGFLNLSLKIQDLKEKIQTCYNKIVTNIFVPDAEFARAEKLYFYYDKLQEIPLQNTAFLIKDQALLFTEISNSKELQEFKEEAENILTLNINLLKVHDLQPTCTNSYTKTSQSPTQITAVNSRKRKNDLDNNLSASEQALQTIPIADAEHQDTFEADQSVEEKEASPLTKKF